MQRDMETTFFLYFLHSNTFRFGCFRWCLVPHASAAATVSHVEWNAMNTKLLLMRQVIFYLAFFAVSLPSDYEFCWQFSKANVMQCRIALYLRFYRYLCILPLEEETKAEITIKP